MSKVKNIQKILSQNKIDALLVSNFYNIVYLTDFKSLSLSEREAWVLVTNKNIYLFTDGRYINKKNTDKKSKIIYKQLSRENNLLSQLKEVIKNEKILKLGFEADDLRVLEFKKFKEKINSIEWQETEKLIIKLREIKNKEEIDKIGKACQVGDWCLKEIAKLIKPGISEKEIAFKIEFWLKEKGYNIAFPPIIAVDKNSSLPHYNTQEGIGLVKNNSLILIDFGVRYKNYCSDITRMIFINPPPQILNIYEKLLSIQEKTINNILLLSIQNGNFLNKVDQFCRKLIVDSQLPNYPHSTGHGVGLEVHEYPKISQNSTNTLSPNQVFTIEPGVYFEGRWGMRIEDTVWVNNNLKAELLTRFSKQPFILNF